MSSGAATSLSYFLKPISFLRGYDTANLRPDLMAGLTVAVILLPQAIAFALIVELPPAMGLYAAIVGGMAGALWGSSNQIHTGPTNAISILVLSSLMTAVPPGSSAFIMAAGLMAVMAGVLQILLGLARLGMLVNFVSHSVIVGFAGGAGVLIAVKQLRHLLGLGIPEGNLPETLYNVAATLPGLHLPTAVLGLLTIGVVIAARKLNPRLPSILIGMTAASAAVYVWGLNQLGVDVVGRIPSSLPPFQMPAILNLDLIAEISAGALAVAAIGLVETSAISRSIAVQTRQRLNTNQEFVGQGMANVAMGFFSGYPGAGSFTRSALNFKAGAKSPMSVIFSALFVVVAVFTVAPLALYLPRAAVAGILIVIAAGMVDYSEISRIWRGARGDAAILAVTFLGTLFLHIEFAVLAGILLSLTLYLINTSTPKVQSVIPDQDFRHFVVPDDRACCPQLGIIEIRGDLYFGAVSHVEKALHDYRLHNPDQRFLLIRMQSVNHCDFSGIHLLESVVRQYRERNGDVFITRVQKPVMKLMRSTRFCSHLGEDHFLSEDKAIEHLFYRVLDPAICIYESGARVFRECQNLPKQDTPLEIELDHSLTEGTVQTIAASDLWDWLRTENPPRVIDVREPREFKRGHIARADLIPLPKLLKQELDDISKEGPTVLVCRGGRRSMRAAGVLKKRGFSNLQVLDGGMLAWESAGLLEAVH